MAKRHAREDDTEHDTDSDRCLTTRAAAELLGMSEITLHQWRMQGKGPKWCRFASRTIRYRLGDLRAFMDATAIGGAK